MSAKGDNPKWSLVYWVGVAVVVIAVGAWCAHDGWFRENFEHAMLNRVFAVAAFAAAVWCIWRGVTEHRSLKRRAAEQGGGEPTQPESPSSPEPSAPQGDKPADQSSPGDQPPQS